MNKLQNYIELGVQELQVTNGQAVAVNPYEWINYSNLKRPLTDEEFTNNIRHNKFNRTTCNLPPLPCAESVKEGRYPIDRFEEVPQWYDDIHEIWREDKDTTASGVFETRIALRLNDQTVDEHQKLMDLLQADIAPFKEQEDKKQKRKQADEITDEEKSYEWNQFIKPILSEPVVESENNNLNKSDMEIKDFTKQGEENGRKLISEIFKGGVKNLDECAKIALISTDLIIKETMEEYTNDENHDRVEHHRDIKKFLQWFIALKPLSELNPNS